MYARPWARGLCLRCARHNAPLNQAPRRHINHLITQEQPKTPPEPTHSPSTPPQHPQPTDTPTQPHPFTLAVKDNISTPSPTTCASPFLSTYTPPLTATIVTQLVARGAALVGKTNLDEFGMGSHSTHSSHGPVSQPGGLSAGGSSGGSALAVATHEADVALGTDTGGSVRLPAAWTGVVGYKPSYGMISRWGVVPYANSLDTVGFLAREVAIIQRLVTGKNGIWSESDTRDPTSLSSRARRRCSQKRWGYDTSNPKLSLAGLRFGLPVEYNIQELDRRIRDEWKRTAESLLHRGARVVPVSLPSTRNALSAYYVIAPAEASSNLAKYDGVRYGTRTTAPSDAEGGVLYASSRSQGFGDEVKRRIVLGSYTLSSEAMDNYFLKAQAVRRLVRRDFDRVFRLENPLVERETFNLSEMDEKIPMENKFGPTEVDFLLCPTAPTVAPRLADLEGADAVDAYVNDVFTVPASLAGLPAVSIPVLVGEKGAAGLQLIGQYWDDARLLAVAKVVGEVLEEEGR